MGVDPYLRSFTGVLMFTRTQSNATELAIFEALELRQHLSVGLVSGVLTARGTEGNDDISISLKAGDTTQLNVNMNGVNHYFARAAVNSIVVNGRLGNDSIQVSNANGVVPFAIWCKGGGDKDTIVGGDFSDTIYGGDADDVIHGGKGNDSMFGGDGKDDIFGTAGHDVIYGGAGGDSLDGGGGRDFIKGGRDNDRISGGIDNDWLFGSAGNDSLLGDAGDDMLVGGPDDDDLDGGSGTDKLYGQLGNDDFVGPADEVKDLASTDNGANTLT